MADSQFVTYFDIFAENKYWIIAFVGIFYLTTIYQLARHFLALVSIQKIVANHAKGIHGDKNPELTNLLRNKSYVLTTLHIMMLIGMTICLILLYQIYPG